MRVLVLGASGMLGHKVMQRFGGRFDVTGTVRGPADRWAGHPVLGSMRFLGEIRAEDPGTVAAALSATRPDVVVNCVGITKQLPAAKAAIPSLEVNALFPHRLAQLCETSGARLIHLSTDCVFSGRKGGYTEDDPSDAEDLYGRTKYLGEVSGPGCLTLRTSIIGRQLEGHNSLIEWFITRRGGEATGYARAIFSGFPTITLADLIGDVIEKHPRLNGLWHVSTDPINKYDLLTLVDQALALGVTLRRDDSFFCDRSLDSTRFRQETGYRPPPWPELVKRMAQDSTPYGVLVEDERC